MKLFFKECILVAGCLLSSIHVLAQQHDTLSNHCSITFRGKVFDGETKEPLTGASIFIEELTKGTFSNAKGEFSFRPVCPGTYTVVCSHFSYKPIRTSVSIHQNAFKSFVLHSDTCVFESVVIETEKAVIGSTNATAELQGKELDRTRGLSLGESLKEIPGIYTVQTGPSISKPVVQGMYGARVLILNNGIRQEGQQWGNEHAPEIDPFIAGKITIIKGASSVRYGSDPIGGVILVDPKELRKEPGLGGEINLVGFSNNRAGVVSGIIDYNFRKVSPLSLRLQGTIKRAGNSKTPDYYLKNTGFRENNFSGAIGYDKGTYGAEVFYSQFNTVIGIFSGSHIGNRTDLYRAINSNVPLVTSDFSYTIGSPYQKINHELFKVKAFRWFDNAGKLEFVYARQNNYRAEYDTHKPDSPGLEFILVTHTANLSFDHDPIKSFSGSIGISGIKQANVFHGRPFIPNFRSYSGGIFWIERWRRNRWELEAGGRYDYKFLEVFKWENNVIVSPKYTFNSFSGSAGGVYKLNERWSLRANFGTAFRPPAVNELFSEGLHHGAAAIEYGNPDLVSEIAYNLSATADFQFKRIHGEVNVFNNYINDYIYLAPEFRDELTTKGAFLVSKYKQADAVFYGADISLMDSLSRSFIYSFKLSLIRAHNRTDDVYFINIPPARIENGIKYAFKDNSTLKDSYAALNYMYVAKQRRVEENSDYLPPPSAYMLFNFDMGSSILIGKQQVNLGFSITNIFNTKYRDYLDRFRLYNDAVGRNFILRIKIPFDLAKK